MSEFTEIAETFREQMETILETIEFPYSLNVRENMDVILEKWNSFPESFQKQIAKSFVKYVTEPFIKYAGNIRTGEGFPEFQECCSKIDTKLVYYEERAFRMESEEENVQEDMLFQQTEQQKTINLPEDSEKPVKTMPDLNALTPAEPIRIPQVHKEISQNSKNTRTVIESRNFRYGLQELADEYFYLENNDKLTHDKKRIEKKHEGNLSNKIRIGLLIEYQDKGKKYFYIGPLQKGTFYSKIFYSKKLEKLKKKKKLPFEHAVTYSFPVEFKPENFLYLRFKSDDLPDDKFSLIEELPEESKIILTLESSRDDSEKPLKINCMVIKPTSNSSDSPAYSEFIERLRNMETCVTNLFKINKNPPIEWCPKTEEENLFYPYGKDRNSTKLHEIKFYRYKDGNPDITLCIKAYLEII